MITQEKFERATMAKVLYKEADAYRKRADALDALIKTTDSPVKAVEYCAEMAMISRLLDTILEMSAQTAGVK